MSEAKPTENHTDEINRILIEEFDISEEELTPSTRLADYLANDPDAIIFTVVRLEDELLITLPDGIENKFVTIQDIYDCVERHAKTS